MGRRVSRRGQGATPRLVGHRHTADAPGGGHHPPAEASVTAADITARLADAGWQVVTAEECDRTLPGTAGRAALLQDVVVRATRRP